MMIIHNCANCGEEIMTDHLESDFCDVECAKEFDLMVLEMKHMEEE